jgi:predicted amidophosphoribosyltransferase
MKECPSCKRPASRMPKRFCSRCQKPIRAHDKWFMYRKWRRLGGVFVTVIEHRHCENPQSYFPGSKIILAKRKKTR